MANTIDRKTGDALILHICIEDLIRTNTVEAGQDNYSSACTAGDFERNMC